MARGREHALRARIVALVGDQGERRPQRVAPLDHRRGAPGLLEELLHLVGPGGLEGVDLGCLMGGDLHPTGPLVGVATQPIARPGELGDGGAKPADLAVVDAAGLVEQGARRAGGAEHLVLVLTVQLAQRRCPLRERGGRGRRAVDRRAQPASGAALPREDDLVRSVGEERLDAARPLPVAHRDAPVRTTEDEVERLDEERLAHAGLPCEHRQPLVQLEHDVVDGSQVDDPERREH